MLYRLVTVGTSLFSRYHKLVQWLCFAEPLSSGDYYRPYYYNFGFDKVHGKRREMTNNSVGYLLGMLAMGKVIHGT